MGSGSAVSETGRRIAVIDIARFYAMALVFYGHFIERLMLLENPAAAQHYKFVYSFHMVLFIILAGTVAKERDLELGFGTFLKHRLASRILPFLFFTAVFMVLPVLFSGDFLQLALPSLQGYLDGLVHTAFGIPLFCVPSWFLLMIFSVEVVHYGAFRFLRSSEAKIAAGAVFFYVVGYWLNLKLDIFNPMKGRVIGWNYLFIHEAITMYAFYLVGVLTRRNSLFMGSMPRRLLYPGIAVCLAAVFLTYSLNNGPFNFNYFDSVVIIFSAHGNFLWFPFTALAGSLLVILLARITAPLKTIVFMGQNTLILMCLNGLFYHYINFRVAEWFLDPLQGSGWAVLAAGTLMTVLSMAVCIPLIHIFNRYVPQLVGKPKQHGPWLWNLIEPPARRAA